VGNSDAALLDLDGLLAQDYDAVAVAVVLQGLLLAELEEVAELAQVVDHRRLAA
jgi:hypothetical protein